MKLDSTMIRLLGRLTDRMDLIRKHPMRYEISAEDLAALRPIAEQLEQQLGAIRIIKVG